MPHTPEVLGTAGIFKEEGWVTNHMDEYNYLLCSWTIDYNIN